MCISTQRAREYDDLPALQRSMSLDEDELFSLSSSSLASVVFLTAALAKEEATAPSSESQRSITEMSIEASSSLE